MKVKCDECGFEDIGTQLELIDRGWCNCIIQEPVKASCTLCSACYSSHKMVTMIQKVVSSKRKGGNINDRKKD